MRVAVVGLGGVGEACAHLMAARGTARSLVLANRSVGSALAVRMDLEQSRAWTVPLSARAVAPWNYAEYRGCDVIVLTAGPRLRGKEKRDEKAAETARLLGGAPGKSIVHALAEHVRHDAEKRSILLVVTNPVEATVTWLAERTGWDRSRIIGLGTTVETARFSRFLADKLTVDASSVWTEIVGEHGQNIEVLDEEAFRRRVERFQNRRVDLQYLLDQTRGAAAAIRKHSEQNGAEQADRLIARLEGKLGTESLAGDVRAALREELAEALSPPATRFAIAAATLEVVEAIGSDRGRILPVSGFTGFAGVPDVALAIPFVVGRAGVAPCMRVPSDLLRKAADSIQTQVDAMRAAVGK